MTDPNLHVHAPYVERRRGPYEITVTHESLGATSVVTLDPETSLALAKRAARAYLTQSIAPCKPGTHVTVHRVTAPDDLTPGRLVYHAHIDEDGTPRMT